MLLLALRGGRVQPRHLRNRNQTRDTTNGSEKHPKPRQRGRVSSDDAVLQSKGIQRDFILPT